MSSFAICLYSLLLLLCLEAGHCFFYSPNEPNTTGIYNNNGRTHLNTSYSTTTPPWTGCAKQKQHICYAIGAQQSWCTYNLWVNAQIHTNIQATRTLQNALGKRSRCSHPTQSNNLNILQTHTNTTYIK